MVGVSSTFTSNLPARIGHKPALFVASLLVAGGMTIIGFANYTLLVMLPIYTVVAIGTSLLDPIIVAIMKVYAPAGTRLLTNTLFALAFTISYMLSSLIISAFFDIFSSERDAYAAIFCFAGVLAVVASILAFTLGTPQFQNTHVNRLEAQIVLSEVARTPEFKSFVAFIALLTINNGFSGIFVIGLPIYMTREFGDDTDWAMVLFILCLVSVLTIVFFSPFVFQVKDYTMIAYGNLLQGISIAILILPPTYMLCSIAAVIFGVGNIYIPRVFDYVL